MKTKKTKLPFKIFDVETVTIALHEFIDEVADLDDLAQLASKLIYNDPIVVSDENNQSYVWENGESLV